MHPLLRCASMAWVGLVLFVLVPATGSARPAPRVVLPGGVPRFVAVRTIERPARQAPLRSLIQPDQKYQGTVTTETFSGFMTSLTFDTVTNTFYFLSGSNLEELQQNGQTTQVANLSTYGFPSTIVWDENTQLFYVSVGYEILAVTPSGAVAVLAGSTTRGTQDGQGPNAQFQNPTGMGLDTLDHYLYVADSDRMRRVDEAGNVVTVGPTGVLGGGPFQSSYTVAFDSRSGMAAIADGMNDDIHLFSPVTQSFRTLAGTCVQSPGGPGCVWLHEDGRGLRGLFATPNSIVYDRQTKAFYLVDTFNNDLRKIDAKGNVTTLAGGGAPALADGIGLAASFLNPTCLGLNPVKNTLLVCDTYGTMRIVTTTGLPAPLPPHALALVPTPSLLSAPSGITRGVDGSLWFSESGTGLMGSMSATTQKMREYPLPGGYAGPHGATADPDGSVWFGDLDLGQQHGYVGTIGPRGGVVETPLMGSCFYGTVTPLYFTPDGTGGTWFFNVCQTALGYRDARGRISQFSVPSASGLSLGNGFVWVGEYNQLQQYAFNGALLATFAGVGAGSGIVQTPDGHIWYINDASGGQVGDFDPTTGTTIVYQLPSCGCTRHDGDLTYGADGALWFTEAQSDKNRFYAGGLGRLTVDGTYTEYHTYEPRSLPIGLAVDANGRVWFADFGANKLGYAP